MAGKGVQLGFLKYVLGFDSLQFSKGISQADADLAKLQKKFAAKGREFQDLGKKMTAFITLPLAGLAAKGIQEAQETAAAMAQVNAALASMGPVAGRSAEQLEKAANAFEGSSLFEADEILSKVTANMLTFGNVVGTNFDQAQQAVIDLATRMGTDLQSATVLVGKALNDPIAGLSSLTRVGIQFTDQQKAQIKAMVEAGNVAGAQAVILGELRRQYGGAAQAAQNANPWNVLKDSFKSIGESIGKILLPLIPPLAEGLKKVADWFTNLSPSTQKWIAIAGGLLVVIGPIVTAFGTLMTVLSPLAGVIGLVGRALLLMLGNPVLLGAAVLIGGIYLAWKNWDKIVAIVQGVYQGVKTWLLDKMGRVFEWAKKKVEDFAKPFKWLYDVVVGHSYIPDMVDEIGSHIARLHDNMEKPIWAVAKSSGEAFAQLKSEVGAVLDRLFPDEARSQRFLAELALVENGMKKLGFTADQVATAVSRLREEYSGELLGKEELPAWLTEDNTPDRLPINLGSLGKEIDKTMAANDDLAKNAKSRTAEVADAFGQMAVGVIGSLRDMVSQFKHGDILGGLQTILNMVQGVASILTRVGVIKTGDPTPRARGGPVVPGRTYLVGEDGPEFLQFGNRGYITPPGKGDGGGGRQARVLIVPTPYFDAHVQGQAVKVAAPMAGQAAVMGASGAMTGIAKRQSRILP